MITIIHSNKGWYAKANGKQITEYYGSRESIMDKLTSMFGNIYPINQ